MSGIAALIRFGGGEREQGLIVAMAHSMAHRGPDGIDCWSREGVALGHCMMRTTPESLEEVQPLANEDDSLVLVMDGRLDNWRELRAELTACGAHLRDRSDAQLALRAYERWGRGCVDHMDGDFALVIWDAQRREAFCARDRMGHRPLHYHWDGSCLAVASELHPLLALPWVEAEPNEGLIAEHLADDLVSLDETLWKGVLRLPPAHRMTIDARGPRLERYWAPDLGSELRYRREEEYAEHYRSLLDDIVRRQSRASKPIACEVSGGLDSSAVFAVAETLRRQGKLLAPAIEAFSLHFEGGDAGRDLGHARVVGEQFGYQLREIPPALKSLDWYRDWAYRYRDLPSPPHGTMQTGLYSAARERGHRVILGGDGGDHWLTGDHTYYADCLTKGDWSEFAACLRRDARTYGPRRALSLAGRYGVVPLLPPSFRRWAREVLARWRGECGYGTTWLEPSLAGVLADRKRGRPRNEFEWQNPVHRGKLRLLSSGHVVLARELRERLASACGLELRSPLYNAAMAQFAFSVPRQWLLRNGWVKYIHRRALQDALPAVVIRRRDKAEFSVVYRGLVADLEKALTPGLCRSDSSEGWVSGDGLARLCADAAAGKSRPAILLWTLFACDAIRNADNLKNSLETPAERA